MDSEDVYVPIQPNSAKRRRVDTGVCILCSSEVPLTSLTKQKDVASWQTLLEAAKIRQYLPTLQYSMVLDEIPDIA